MKRIADDLESPSFDLTWIHYRYLLTSMKYKLLLNFAVRSKLSPAGFEPALPKETDLKSVALDHSAKVTFADFNN